MPLPGSPPQIIAIFTALLSVIGTIYLQWASHPNEQYSDKVEKLQDHHWTEVSSELGDLFVEIESTDVDQAVDNDDENYEEDLTKEAKYSLLIYQEYNRGDITDLTDEIEDIDTARRTFEICREKYDSASKYLLWAAGSSIVSLILFLLPNNGVWNGLGLFIIGGTAVLIFTGFRRINQWQTAREDLDKRWEDVTFM